MAAFDRSISSETFRRILSLLNMKFLALVLLPGLAVSQSLPDAPSPKFSSKVETAATIFNFGARAADAGLTCHMMFSQHYQERWLPAHNCTQVTLWSIGFAAAAHGASRFLHRLGRNKVESAPQWFDGSQGLAGILYTLTRHRPHLVR